MPETPNPFEELEEPSVDDSALQQQEPEQPTDDDGTAEVAASPEQSSQTATTTSTTKGLLGSLHPQVPPTPNDWPKVYQAMKAMEGRVRAAQRAGTQMPPQIQQKVQALDDYLSIPGMQDVLSIYFDQKRSSGRDFDIRELFNGQGGQPTQAGGKQPQAQQDADFDPLGMTPSKFNAYLRTMGEKIADERARGIADPLYQQVGSMKMESEMAVLRANNPDADKYADQISHILSQTPNLSAEDAYHLAKARAGVYRARPRPNAQAAFSEGAGSRGEQDGGVSEEARMRRELMMSGQNGRL